MEISAEQFKRIKESLPVERGNVSISQQKFLNAVLYVLENGCKWRKLPKEYGNWHTLYTRMKRWSKAGVFEKVFKRLQQEQIISIKMKVLSLDSTSLKVHPDGSGALKKPEHNPLEKAEEAGTQRYIWLPQMIGLR